MPKKKSNVHAALTEVKKKGTDVSVQSIARKYGVPSSTLHVWRKFWAKNRTVGKANIKVIDSEILGIKINR